VTAPRGAVYARGVSLRLAVLIAACAALACTAPAAAPAATRDVPLATAAPTATPSPEPGALTFRVQTGSKAIVRVREQLAGVSAPNDAVLESREVSGGFGLRADGSFSADSKITVGLATLSSDSDRRDSFIQGETLETRRFPTADFVPLRAVGLPTPLPASGEWSFQVVGRMTIRGVEKEVAWDVRAKRDAAALTASAKNAPAWTFGDFRMRIPRVFSVLSINDEIRVEIELIARG
jgi:polyisoprenoid-binding protein YceI